MTPLLVLACVGAAAIACGSTNGMGPENTDRNATPTSSGGPGNFGGGGAGSAGDPGSSGTPDGRILTSMRVDPADATLDVLAGNVVTKQYRVLGTYEGDSGESDITARAVFYVPDNYLIGGFPASGAPTFSTRLPASANDPPARGGVLTVRAQAASGDGSIVTATTKLTVRYAADRMLAPPSGSQPVPANAAALFGGAADASRAPRLAYPNDGAFLPPNLKRLEVHWRPASAATTLYEVSFTSSTTTQRFYSRCNSLGDGMLKDGACGFELDGDSFAALAEANRGGGDVALSVRATSESGGGVGASATFHVRFGETNVEGGIYYWDVTHTRIMRYDFAGTQAAPEVFIAPGDYGLPNNCVGCHTISRDGTKIVASLNGQGGGQLVYLNDLAKAPTPPLPARTDANYLTKKGAGGTGASGNQIQFASFNPSGSRFAAVYGETDDGPSNALDRNKLWMHDGSTGDRIGSVQLDFEPDHPEWSPDGSTIAVTHVNGHNTSQQARKGGIDLLRAPGGNFTTATTTATTLLPFVSGKNRFNPSFAPDSSFLFFTEATCPGDGCITDVVGADGATTWAIAPRAGANPVHLDNAAAAGVTDGDPNNFRDTFPRATPFESKQGTGKRFWFTVASRREPGERKKTSGDQQLLWMFAVDPAKIAAGQDGSERGFFLPFQDLQTSNHIGQWTQKIVSSTPPAPPPPTPDAPPPPKVPSLR